MNTLTRRNSFSANENTRQSGYVDSSHSRRRKKRNRIYDILGTAKIKGSMSRPQRLITKEDLDFYLYGRTDVFPVKLEEGSPDKETAKQQNLAKKIPNYEGKSVDILQLRYRPGVEKEFRSSEEFNKVLSAIKHIPSQLHLCYSSIPGAGFGICATETIPSGTWIGPYEGKRISIQETKTILETGYLWEIYKNGVLDHAVDGIEPSEKSTTGWMKYIRCARNTSEQNTVVFQFGADIYFQTYKTINPGEEILAWYAEYYEQYFGIPVGVKKLNKTKETSQTATSAKEILERAQRNINEITPTKLPLDNPRPVRPRALQLTATTQTLSLIPPVNSTKRPPASNGNYTISHTSPEFPPSKPKCPPTLPRVTRENESTSNISPPINVDKATSSQDSARTEDFRVALRNMKTRFWKCEHCLSRFPQKWALQVHSCPRVVTKPYLCNNCSKSYPSKDGVQAHASQCGAGKQYRCAYCGRSFLNVNILSKHLKVHSRKSVAGALKRKTILPFYHRLVQ